MNSVPVKAVELEETPNYEETTSKAQPATTVDATYFEQSKKNRAFRLKIACACCIVLIIVVIASLALPYVILLSLKTSVANVEEALELCEEARSSGNFEYDEIIFGVCFKDETVFVCSGAPTILNCVSDFNSKCSCLSNWVISIEDPSEICTSKIEAAT